MLADEDSDSCQKPHDHVCHNGPPNRFSSEQCDQKARKFIINE